MNELFEDTKIRSMSDETLQEFKESFNSDTDYHKQMYDKYSPIYGDEPIDIERIFSVESLDYLKEVSYFLLHKAKQGVEEYIQPSLDLKDLKKLLDQDIEDEPGISDNSNTTGLRFCDHFSKEYRLGTRIAGKGENSALLSLRDDYSLYIAVLKAMYFHKTRVSPKSILRTVELITPVVSNIRPMFNVLAYSEYGVKRARQRGQNYVSILVSSEGWLGRAIAGYKVAYDNPDLQVYYTSCDPNIQVNRSFRKLVKVLNEYHKLDNWHPENHLTGSEHFKEKRVHESKAIPYDMQITSSPYYNLESYSRTYKIFLDNLIPQGDYPEEALTVWTACVESVSEKTTISREEYQERVTQGETFYTDSGEKFKDNMITLSEDETLTVQGENRYEEPKKIKAKELHVGSVLYETGFQIVNKEGIEQSHQLGTPEEWRVNFQLETFKNVYNMLVPGGYNLINIANVKTCMFLEDYTEKSFLEAGFEQEAMEWYKLSRKPSKNPDSAITIRKGEPLFIYKKPVNG